MVVSLLIPRHFSQEMGAGAILDTTDAQNVPETPDTDHTAAGADATENTDAVTDGAAADPSLSEQQTDESENAEVTDEEVYGAYVTETEEDIPALREEITDLIDELGTAGIIFITSTMNVSPMRSWTHRAATCAAM